MNITDSAKAQFKEIGGIIRYSLNGGGCSGLIGKWDVVDHINHDEDIIIWRSCPPGTMGGKAAEQEDCPALFVIDSFTIEHMDGATVDYTGGPFSPAFKVFIPDKASCGCGESFVL
jgi:Fe-S cluster assembly iron-binding protein IscA